MDVTQTPPVTGCPNEEGNLEAHVAQITLGAAVLGGGTTNAMRITINSYSMTYVLVANAISPPTIAPITYGELIILNVESTVSDTFNLFTDQQKTEF